MGLEPALRELQARPLKDLLVDDNKARSLLVARQALFFEAPDATVLGDPETLLIAARVLGRRSCRPTACSQRVQPTSPGSTPSLGCI